MGVASRERAIVELESLCGPTVDPMNHELTVDGMGSPSEEEIPLTGPRRKSLGGREFTLSSRQISFNERLTLSPITKFKRHGKFPFKLMFHILCLVAVSGLILTRNIQFAAFTDATQSSLRHLLKDKADQPEELYSVTQVKDHLKETVMEYLQYANSSVSPFTVEDTVSIQVQVFDGDDYSFVANMADPLGPLTTISTSKFHR